MGWVGSAHCKLFVQIQAEELLALAYRLLLDGGGDFGAGDQQKSDLAAGCRDAFDNSAPLRRIGRCKLRNIDQRYCVFGYLIPLSGPTLRLILQQLTEVEYSLVWVHLRNVRSINVACSVSPMRQIHGRTQSFAGMGSWRFVVAIRRRSAFRN